MIAKIDKLSDLKAAGQKGGGYLGKDLAELSQSLADVSSKLGPEYTKLLVDKFTSLPAPVVRPDRIKAKRKEKPVHPGLVIAKIIAKRKLDKGTIIAKIKAGPEAFEAILETRASMTKEIANDLARLLGETPSYWMGLQRKFDQYKP